MVKHSETRHLKYSTDQMFSLVADIESYPIFIPWCRAVRVMKSTENKINGHKVLVANMAVSFKVFKESFTTKITLHPDSKRITVEYINGPFKILNNEWIFNEVSNGCSINFNVEFEFKSRMMQALVGVVFQEAMRRIVRSFEQRADVLHK
jgi:coenzyme Q-binding protein COQ10